MKMILFLLLAMCSALAACNMENSVLTAENKNAGNETFPIAMEKTPVLVELYTSEG